MINFSVAELQYINELMLKARVRIIRERTVGMSAEERVEVAKELFKVLKYPDGAYIQPLQSDAQRNALIVDRIEQEMVRITDIVKGEVRK